VACKSLTELVGEDMRRHAIHVNTKICYLHLYISVCSKMHVLEVRIMLATSLWQGWVQGYYKRRLSPSSTDTVHDAKTEAQKQVVESTKLPRQPFLITDRDGEKSALSSFSHALQLLWRCFAPPVNHNLLKYLCILHTMYYPPPSPGSPV